MVLCGGKMVTYCASPVRPIWGGGQIPFRLTAQLSKSPVTEFANRHISSPYPLDNSDPSCFMLKLKSRRIGTNEMHILLVSVTFYGNETMFWSFYRTDENLHYWTFLNPRKFCLNVIFVTLNTIVIQT